MTETPAARPSETRVQRLQRLRRAVETSGALHLKDAAELLKVSEMTVRARPCRARGGTRPARRLRRQCCFADRDQVRIRTGNRPAYAGQAPRLPIRSRLDQGRRHHLHRLRRHDAVAGGLPPELPLSVICYSLNVASIVTHRPATQVMLMGGLTIRRRSRSRRMTACPICGDSGSTRLSSPPAGCTGPAARAARIFHEVAIKQAVIATAMESIVVVDASKLGSLKPAFFSDVSSFSQITSVASCRQTRASTSAAFPSNTSPAQPDPDGGRFARRLRLAARCAIPEDRASLSARLSCRRFAFLQASVSSAGGSFLNTVLYGFEHVRLHDRQRLHADPAGRLLTDQRIHHRHRFGYALVIRTLRTRRLSGPPLAISIADCRPRSTVVTGISMPCARIEDSVSSAG